MSLVSTITVGSGGASSIQFTSIPQDGTDLVLSLNLRSDWSSSANDFITCYVNEATTGYSAIALYGTGSAAFAYSWSPPGMDLGYTTTTSQTALTFSSHSVYFSNYANSTGKVSRADVVTENNAGAAAQFILANSWSGTSPITSLRIQSGNGGLLVQNSTASLYKITKGSDGTTVVS